MKKISENQIKVSENILDFNVPIKKIIEYKNFFVVLLKERKEIPNNIIFYNYSGNELFKINDIVKAKIPRGYFDMEKVSENLLKAYYELGIIYDIDLTTMSIIKETYSR